LDPDELKKMQVETEGGIESIMQNLSIDDHSANPNNLSQISVLKENKDLTQCLEKSFQSTKLGRAFQLAEELLEQYPEDKLIIVSQWTSILKIMAENFDRSSIEYYEVKGDVPLFRRNELVEQFNDKSNNDVRVMLLSLCAGGVGLNLVGANRMFLLDIHWNPALESQASDRIYRVGQTKDVTVYRFICENTIEERIEQIQKTKIDLAHKVVSASASNIPGMSTSAKLNLNDFKLLFQGFEEKKT
jgi:transcription termination factor 2